MGENTVIITKKEYRDLIESRVRIDIFAEYVNNSRYSISRDECASLLGFDLEEKDGDA